jgi:DNA-binding response OmpR family regulator
MTQRKILIVGDEPSIVMSLEFAFKKKGYEVFIARDGHEALDAAEMHRPDAIVLDDMISGMDGFETLSVIRSKPGLDGCKVVFLTAKTKNEDIALVADKYLTKPFSIKKVIQCVEELLKI